jgi:solute carrier family 35 (GDP-fucose transporter), member C1
MIGFYSGVSGEAVGQTSTAGIAWGIWSSLSTAIETVVIKKSVSGPKVGILDLVYVTAVATGPVFAVVAVLNGEYLQVTSLGLTHPILVKFSKEALVAGIFNFLLSTAAYLQIKATSPTT